MWRLAESPGHGRRQTGNLVTTTRSGVADSRSVGMTWGIGARSIGSISPESVSNRGLNENFEMPDFDVETFITKLDRMGMKLTAVPLADGKLRVNRWCMLNAAEHAHEIEDLWTTQIGNDRERIDVLAAYLAKAAPREAVERISSSPIQIGSQSQSTVVPDTAVGPDVLADPQSAAGPHFGAPPQGPPEDQMATSVPAIASSPPSAAPQRGDEKLPSRVLASILKVAYRQP